MFMGEYQHNIDNKGRIIVPSKFRDNLGEQFVITRGLDQCLFAYPMDEWRLLEEKLKKTTPHQKKMQGPLRASSSQGQWNARLINRAE